MVKPWVSRLGRRAFLAYFTSMNSSALPPLGMEVPRLLIRSRSASDCPCRREPIGLPPARAWTDWIVTSP